MSKFLEQIGDQATSIIADFLITLGKSIGVDFIKKHLFGSSIVDVATATSEVINKATIEFESIYPYTENHSFLHWDSNVKKLSAWILEGCPENSTIKDNLFLVHSMKGDVDVSSDELNRALKSIKNQSKRNQTVNNIQMGVQLDRVIELLESIVKEHTQTLWTANFLYLSNYVEPLFLHKKPNIENSVGSISENLEKFCKDSYALCCYWKQNTQYGAVEFYHNNIRDFFLCEKIFYEMEKIYQSSDLSIDNVTPFIQKFSALFKFSKIQPKVIEFIYSRISYEKENSNLSEFIKIERDKKLFPCVFKEMLTYGGIYKYEYTTKRKENIFQSMTNILYSVLYSYLCIYQPFRAENEYIDLWNDVFVINHFKIFKSIADDLAHPPSYDSILLRYLNLTAINLTDVDLSGADLSNADLTLAILPDGYKIFEEIAHLKSLNIPGLKI